MRSIVQEVEMIGDENRLINKDFLNDQEKYAHKREELNNRMKVNLF